MKQAHRAALSLASLAALSLGISGCGSGVSAGSASASTAADTAQAQPANPTQATQATQATTTPDGQHQKTTSSEGKAGGHTVTKRSAGPHETSTATHHTQTKSARPDKPHVSAEVQDAVSAAQSYLQVQAFSKKGLIQQLSSKAGEGYARAVAEKAVGQLSVNWNTQAVKAAKSYLSISSFSRQGLIQQLESSAGDGFTHAQAVYGVQHAYGSSTKGGSGGDKGTGTSAEVHNAIGAAKSYLQIQAFSKNGLIRQLSSSAGDGYDRAVAEKAVDQLTVNWNTQAVKAAKSYLSISSFSRQGLIQQLQSPAGDEFTHAQAVYGVDHAYGK